jgi:uncharacterized protein YbjT (DUF2867 family)
MPIAMSKSPILVTGGTGTLGRQVVSRLRDAGYGVRVFSRKDHDDSDGIEFVKGDLLGDQGIQSAVEGVSIVVHCAGGPKGDGEATSNLVRAALGCQVEHLVYISVIGADRVPQIGGIDRKMFGYFGAKLAAERAIVDSGLAWTTLRAAQFHDLMFKVAQAMAKLPLIPIPAGFRFQPVDSGEVAARLVQVALGSPAGLLADIAGPRVYGMDELLNIYLRTRGKKRLMMPLHIPGQAAGALRAGANLAPEQAIGRRTWEEFLADRVQTEVSSASS